MKVIKTPLLGEPVTLADMKNFLRVDFAHDDALIGDMITSARQEIENRLNISIVKQRIELFWPNYRPLDWLPYSPVIEWESIEIDGEAVTPPQDDMLRYTAGDLVAVYVAGYEDVPRDITQAIRGIVKYNYDGEGDIVNIYRTIDHHNRNAWL
jgi:hypothetical protein